MGNILGGPDVVSWARAHPRGLLVVTLDESVLSAMSWRPEAIFPYRSKRVVMWSAQTVLDSDGKVMGDRY